MNGDDWTGDAAMIAHLEAHGVFEEAERVVEGFDAESVYSADEVLARLGHYIIPR